MTEAINFFQSIFMFKNFAPVVSANKQEIKLAIWLKREAQNLAAVAEQESRSGQTAQNLAMTARDGEKIRVFSEIALWHFKRAAEKYRQSSERFAEAGTIKTGKSRKFNKHAVEMARRAAAAAAAVNFLNGFLNN